MVSSKKKWTVMNPIRRQMKKRNPSSAQRKVACLAPALFSAHLTPPTAHVQGVIPRIIIWALLRESLVKSIHFFTVVQV